MYEVDRKTASKMLKVSVRTIDRYIVGNKLSIERRDGRIWLDRKELMEFKEGRKGNLSRGVSTPVMSMDEEDVIMVDTSIDDNRAVYSQDAEDVAPERRKHRVDIDHFKVDTRNRSKSQIDELVYKNLFEQLQEELKEKQDRLEGANYRVGQLEARLKESVPLLDYNRALSTERSEKEAIRKNLDAQQFEAEQLLNALKEEKFNKKVYLIILFILLLLQPLWFFFPIK